MRVQRVVMPVTGAESWTVVDDGWAPVEPVERYLAHLAGIERSPNTVRAYAHGLRLCFEFLGARRLVWDSVGIEDVSRFVAWLRAPADNVIVFDDTAAVRSAATLLVAVTPDAFPAAGRWLDRLPAVVLGAAVGAAYAVTLAAGRYDDLIGELYRIATSA